MDDFAFDPAAPRGGSARPRTPRRALRLALSSLLLALLIACGSSSPPPDGGDGGITSPTSGPIELETNGSDAREQARFTLTNTADRSLSWELRVVWNPDGDNPQGGSWFDYAPARGTIPAGGETELTLTLDEGLDAGSYTADLFVDYPGGSTPFVVTGQVGDPGFDIRLERTELTLAPGGSADVEVELIGFDEPIVVDVASSPAGVDAEIVENGNPNDSIVLLRISAGGNAASGDVVVSATAEQGGATQRATLELTVEGDAPAGDGTLRGNVTTVNADVPVDPPVPGSLDGACSSGSAVGVAATLAADRPAFVPGELLVAYDDASFSRRMIRQEGTTRLETSAEARARGFAELRADFGLELVRSRGVGRADVVRLPAGSDVRAVAERLESDPRVRYAEPNWLVYPAGVPDDPCVDALWQLPVAGLPLAWEERRASGDGSGDVVIAVVDSGVDLDHPDLRDAFVSGGYDFCDELSGGSCSATDGDVRPSDASDQHGTHVTGVLAARGSNGRGVAGAVPGAVRVLPVKVFRDFFTGTPVATIADGILWAAGETVAGAPDNPYPADIVNLSLGFDADNPDIADDDVRTLREAVEAAQAAGALLVAAAGNYGADTLAFPARLDGVISVGAVNSELERSCFSNAPGGNSADRAEHVMAPGGDGFACDAPRDEAILSTFQGGTYGVDAGTSQAAPIVSGVAALVWAEQGSSATAASVREALLDAAWRPDGASRSEFGQGILRADAALGFPGPGAEVSVALSGPESGVDVVRLGAFGESTSFSFSGLPAGGYTLEASAGGLDATRSVDLGADESRSVDLRLEP